LDERNGRAESIRAVRTDPTLTEPPALARRTAFSSGTEAFPLEIENQRSRWEIVNRRRMDVSGAAALPFPGAVEPRFIADEAGDDHNRTSCYHYPI
jgi:hypothetical protein